MQLTSENYYSQEANKEYMSVSGYKDFAGTYGKMPCEFYGMEKLNGRWEDEKSTALLVGSYVDSYFEGSLEQFKKENPEIFTQKGELKANFKQAEEIIARIERDEYFMKFMSGQKQVIMTGELFGAKWKIKMDSYIPDVAIVDLKVMASITDLKWVKDIGYLDFVRYWGYDIQGAIYQGISRQLRMGNTVFPEYYSEFIERRLQLDRAMEYCNALQDELQFIAETIPCDKNKYMNIVLELNKLYNYIKSLRASDNKFLPKIKKNEGNFCSDCSSVVSAAYFANVNSNGNANYNNASNVNGVRPDFTNPHDRT